MSFDIKGVLSTKDTSLPMKKQPNVGSENGKNVAVEPREAMPSSTLPMNDVRDITAAMDKVRELAKGLNRNLQFSIDRDTGRTIIKIVNADNGDVVRQIPSEDFLALSKNLDQIKGLLIHAKA